jgi:hypothetical protein
MGEEKKETKTRFAIDEAIRSVRVEEGKNKLFSESKKPK